MIRSNRRSPCPSATGARLKELCDSCDPGPQHADLLDARDVRLGSLQQLREVTGCEFGKLAPVGSLVGLPLLLDWDLLAEDEIYLNPAPLMMSMAVEPSASRALENHSATERPTRAAQVPDAPLDRAGARRSG
jgi:hypothetical protein